MKRSIALTILVAASNTARMANQTFGKVDRIWAILASIFLLSLRRRFRKRMPQKHA